MIFLYILFFLVVIYLISAAGYFFLLTLAAFSFHKKVKPDSPPKHILVVIPAHNEAAGINATIKSVRQATYPANCFAVLVIADNCEDQTAVLAQAAGAQVAERVEPLRRGKGQALDWFFQTHRGIYERYDAVAIIDADTLMDADFLTQVSQSLSHPEVEVVQGYYGVSNPGENWRTALATAALCVFHHLRPAGRNRAGGSAGLKGNGMAFSTLILKETGWPAYSIVEDLEFSIMLLFKNVLVHYNPDAIVLGEMAGSRVQADTQRQRWEGGRLEVFKKFALPILRRAGNQSTAAYLDAFMDLFTPPLSILLLALFSALGVAALFWPVMMPILTTCLVIIVFYVISGLLLRKASAIVWLYLAASPLFLGWKIIVYIGMLFKKGGKDWMRTARKGELSKKSTEE